MKHVSGTAKSRQLDIIERKLKKKDEFYSRFRCPDWAKRCLLSLLDIEKDSHEREMTGAILEGLAELALKRVEERKRAARNGLTLIRQEV